MRNRTLIALIVLTASLSFGQSQGTDDELVTVPKRYVSSEGLQHQQNPNPKGQEWIGIGKEIGIATREGLTAVVDTAEKFGSTKVGTFVMVMIAWKIMAKDVLGIIIGIPIMLGGVALWVWTMKRLFFGYRVLVKRDGKLKEYADHPAYKFAGAESRAAIGVAAVCSIGCWIGLMTFLVIF